MYDHNKKSTMLFAVEREFEWMKWYKEIPPIRFPADWNIKIIPPAVCGIVRFWIVDPDTTRSFIASVYLDCYDLLGFCRRPYWEAYPYKGDVFRCGMEKVDLLLEALHEIVEDYYAED